MSNTQKIVDIQKIVDNGNYAAKLCLDLTEGGYSDWFLPSLDELNLMFENLQLKGIGSFGDHFYWSSSEHAALNAWYQYFGQGYQSNNNFKINYLARVRAVRAF